MKTVNILTNITYICPFCWKSFFSPSALSSHLKNLHTDKEGIFRCCGVVTTESSQMDHIINNHLNHIPEIENNVPKKNQKVNFKHKPTDDVQNHYSIFQQIGLGGEFSSFEPSVDNKAKAVEEYLDESYKRLELEFPSLISWNSNDDEDSNETQRDNLRFHPFKDEFE